MRVCLSPGGMNTLARLQSVVNGRVYPPSPHLVPTRPTSLFPLITPHDEEDEGPVQWPCSSPSSPTKSQSTRQDYKHTGIRGMQTRREVSWEHRTRAGRAGSRPRRGHGLRSALGEPCVENMVGPSCRARPLRALRRCAATWMRCPNTGAPPAHPPGPAKHAVLALQRAAAAALRAALDPTCTRARSRPSCPALSPLAL